MTVPCPSLSLRWPEQVPNGARGQGGLGQEPDRGACRYEVGVVLLGVGRDEDCPRPGQARRAMQSPHQVKATLIAEVDVHQRDVRPELLRARKRLGRARRHSYDGDPFTTRKRGLSSMIRQRSTTPASQATRRGCIPASRGRQLEYATLADKGVEPNTPDSGRQDSLLLVRAVSAARSPVATLTCTSLTPTSGFSTGRLR